MRQKFRIQSAEPGTMIIATDRGSFRVIGADIFDDNDLLKLGKKFEAAQKRLTEKRGPNLNNSQLGKADKIALSILDRSANTLAGFRLKQRAVEFLEPDAVENDWWKRIARSLQKDLMRV